MQVVYGDILFLINFCMDLLCIYLAGRVLSLEMPILRLLFASALGGVYGVASVFMPGLPIITAITGVAVSGLMCFVAFGGCGPKNYLRSVALMYIASVLLGGGVSLFYNMLSRYLPNLMESIGRDESGEAKSLLFFGVAALCSLLAVLARRLLSFRTQLQSIKIYVTFDGREGSFTALVDSGNLLSDPISGRKVIVARLTQLEHILPDSLKRLAKSGDVLQLDRPDYNCMKRVRMIPSRSVNGSRLLVGFLPDRVEIDCGGRTGRRRVDAIIALESDSASDFGGYQAIVPSSLVA